MAERVHPHNSPSHNSPSHNSPPHNSPPLSPPTKPSSPPSATYVIKIPKDQVYRIPPPDNAINHRNNHRRNCRCCCCLFGILFILILILAIVAAVFYLVFRPKALDYSIQRIAVRGLNLTSPSSSMSPEFDFTVKANNPNDKIGIRYLKESSVEIFFKDVMLGNGVMPAFYQPSNNVTVFKTVLKGNGIELRGSDRKTLTEAQKKLEVPLSIKVRVAVRVKVGSVESGKMTVTAECDVTVDKLTAQAKIVSRHCNYGVVIFWVVKI
ncbi:hypothetical protein TanjilG_29561 [Lupinus angustifolius]|uniref:Late embryogenesis abundant protein LEA-2 subgroup domain-containing protein n=1 Tax=Lupinus angustifolius TaxID=3871 RepID=A0A4P1R6M7_LUPAN|nr:PREDICTED: protein YLS9-like [Lupinus angustifolius]OIW02785.1 hypothetical protein TanjilG_29561 [Lupinus angustifolius]